jgi:hypothetical protein
METVSVSRTFDASPQAVRDEMQAVEPFMVGAGFDEVRRDGERLQIENSVGLLTISLDLRLLDTDDTLAYEQVDGIFEEMETRYRLEPAADGVTVTATTEFALDVALVGSLLDSTIITRQRRRELTNQFDYLAEAVGSAGDDSVGTGTDERTTTDG